MKYIMKYVTLRRVICKSYTIAAGTLDNSHEGIFNKQIPSRLVIGMVDNIAVNGSYRSNPFNFKHFDVRCIKLILDGQSSNHIREIETHFYESQYINAYLSLFAGSGNVEGTRVLISRGKITATAILYLDTTSAQT
jgi:hypothetical protein